MKKIIFALTIIGLASCTQEFEYKQADPYASSGHLDNFISKSDSVTKEIQKDSVDTESTIKLTLALSKYQELYPERYRRIATETNGWEIAKMLKRDKDFLVLAKKSGLDMNSVPFIERND